MEEKQTTTKPTFCRQARTSAFVTLFLGYVPLVGVLLTGIIIPILVYKGVRPVNELIADRGDPNVKSGGEPAIVHAARTGQHHLISGLIKAGADATAQSRALEVAASNGDVIALKILLESGCATKAKPTLSKALLKASWGHVDAMRILIDAGADVNARALEPSRLIEISPLTAAVMAQHLEAVRLLRVAGAFYFDSLKWLTGNSISICAAVLDESGKGAAEAVLCAKCGRTQPGGRYRAYYGPIVSTEGWPGPFVTTRYRVLGHVEHFLSLVSG